MGGEDAETRTYCTLGYLSKTNEVELRWLVEREKKFAWESEVE